MDAAKFYEPPEDVAGTVFDPYDATFGPIMAALQAGDFEEAAESVKALTETPKFALAIYCDGVGNSRMFDPEEEAIDAIGEALQQKERWPDSVITILVGRVDA